MNRTEDGWIAEYQKAGALWIHDEKPGRPHVLLSSKKHSNGFFFSKLVVDENLRLLSEAAEDLIDLAIDRGLNLYGIDCVVGPATGATKMAEAIALAIGNKRGYICR